MARSEGRLGDARGIRLAMWLAAARVGQSGACGWPLRPDARRAIRRRPLIEIHPRSKGWTAEEFASGSLRLDCLDIDLNVADVYADVSFPPERAATEGLSTPSFATGFRARKPSRSRPSPTSTCFPRRSKSRTG